MTQTNHRMWVANPHQFGPGKIHIVDDRDDAKTLCGRFLAAVPGAISTSVKPTCRICLDAAVRRPEQERQRQEFERRRVEQDRERAAENAQWQEWYADYLRSPEWRALRAKVIARANHRCEGCGDTAATEVHHLTYAHVGAEFLWELRAICRGCHQRITALNGQGQR